MYLWEGVSEFVAVAESNSFTIGAKRLGISTAQVSRQISALEKRLGVKLLYRTTRKISLTQEGCVYFQDCQDILKSLAEAEQSIVSVDNIPRGKIRLTAPVTYGEEVLGPLVNDFMLMHEHVEVDFHLTNAMVDLVDGGYDLAIRHGKLDDSSMMAKRLSKRSMFVCASPEYVKQHGAPTSLSELKNHNCLLGSADFWRFQPLGNNKHMRVSGTLRCNNGYSLLDAALKGIGIAQLPNHYVEAHIKDGRLLVVLEEFREPDEGVWALYPNNRQLSPKVRLLVDFFAEKIANDA